MKITQSLRNTIMLVAKGKDLEREYGYNAGVRLRAQLKKEGFATFPLGSFVGTLTAAGEKIVEQERTPLAPVLNLKDLDKELVKAGIDPEFLKECRTSDLVWRLRDEYGAVSRAKEVQAILRRMGQ